MDEIRVSYGTAMTLGLESGKSEEEPTTAYLMIPGEKCRGGCTFCPQAKANSKWLSRVSWPLFDIEEVKAGLNGSDFSRTCIQSPDVRRYEKKLKETVKKLECGTKSISISSPPLDGETLLDLEGSVDRIGVGIDAVTDSLRSKVKPAYNPRLFWKYLGKAIDIYGEGKVTAHLIVGLGEDLEELAVTVKKILRSGSQVSLFAYKTEEKEVDMKYYRKAQLLTALLYDDFEVHEALRMVLNNPKQSLQVVDEKKIFQTRGCPQCNRPYYTSSPGKEHKNFPRPPTAEEINKIKDDLCLEDG